MHLNFKRTGLAFLFGTALSVASAMAAPLPGAAPTSQSALAALEGMQPVSPPRTKHLDASGAPIYRNRLLHERSPYLRQHAHNPIDWRAWGPEALADAAARGVPIFLSVGYATCHWCHVMEEESFDDPGVAETMNRSYVAIKVDRETLPHIDSQYMIATQILNGNGGWPNNLFLTPEGQPIAAMGYAPRNVFHDALRNVSGDWNDAEGQKAMREQAGSVAMFVGLISNQRGVAARVDEGVFAQASAELLNRHDELEGGFSNAPKFPNESMIRFLLDRFEREGDTAARDAALLTLRAIVAGGIHDHVGGGFHRYSTDSAWRTPHFEKMLYNQALLGGNLLQAYRLTGDPVLGRAARRAMDYVIRDMTAPGGAFFAAEDADSAISPGGPKEEGAFYTWRYEQLDMALSQGESGEAARLLGLDQQATLPTGAVAHLDPDLPPDFNRLDPLLERLRLGRKSRPAPLIDTKVIAGWNGLMIATLAEASIVLQEPRYAQAAARASDFVLGRMLDGSGNLARAYADGPLEEGTLRDYVWMSLGLVGLYDATGERRHLDSARRLADQVAPRFGDGAENPLKFAQSPGPLGSSYDVLEGATPTGNASAVELYTRLSRRIGDDATAVTYEHNAEALIAALSSAIVDAPGDNISATGAAARHIAGETGPIRHLGNGAATAKISADANGVRVKLDFGPGWHANNHQPLSDNLIPTSLSGNGVANIRYPQSRPVQLGFQAEPVMVIDGGSEIAADRTMGGDHADLEIQICGDDYCLPPENVRFRFAPMN